MVKIFLVRDRNAFSTKWVCDFGSNLDSLGYDVSVVCNQKKYKHINNVPLSQNVQKINLGKKFTIFTPLKFKKLIKKEKPDVVFAYFLKDLFNLSLCLSSTKIVMMFHNPPVEVFEKIKNPITKITIKYLLKKVASIQVLMPEFKKQINDFVGDVKVDAIPNQVMIKDEYKTEYNKKVIIQVAQIAKYNKRQHLLIEAFAQIAHKYPDWQVHFYGKAKKGKHQAYYQECLAKIKELGLENQLIFKGFSKNITNDYLNAEINTLPSRSEGFGYGLADGLALGLPSIGFADAAAINEIIVDEKSGFLVKDVDDYAKKLDLLMANSELRQKMGQFGINDMQNRYSPAVVMNLWNQLIKDLII
jgi:glycosyltransferase involved in cell wall biosynthesis